MAAYVDRDFALSPEPRVVWFFEERNVVVPHGPVFHAKHEGSLPYTYIHPQIPELTVVSS